ncbi:hypothetical protein MHBO_002778 [Bonamia ostreae]|uniref:RNA helicase n=1 Tax=Bonamia ostreae TaxID=126728 RepID=A0ABV2ANJ0_9EUKA
MPRKKATSNGVTNENAYDIDKEPLEDYEEPVEEVQEVNNQIQTKGSYAGKQAAGFRDFLLKPELLRAIGDCGFEHPSEVQQECIPVSAFGTDLICQAKSGMGKTAVFVLSVLQQIDPNAKELDTLVLCHCRELAFQICQEFNRLSKYLPSVKEMAVFGGIPEIKNIEQLSKDRPQIVIGTPGRVLSLVERQALDLSNLKRFILDECDKMLESLDMRYTVQQIFKRTPREKQVLMFSATIKDDVRKVCKKFAREVFTKLRKK